MNGQKRGKKKENGESTISHEVQTRRNTGAGCAFQDTEGELEENVNNRNLIRDVGR